MGGVCKNRHWATFIGSSIFGTDPFLFTFVYLGFKSFSFREICPLRLLNELLLDTIIVFSNDFISFTQSQHLFLLQAGIMEEIVNDALDSALDSEDIEDEIDEEVDKVLTAIAGETSAQLPAAVRKERLKQPAQATEDAEVLSITSFFVLMKDWQVRSVGKQVETDWNGLT